MAGYNGDPEHDMWEDYDYYMNTGEPAEYFTDDDGGDAGCDEDDSAAAGVGEECDYCGICLDTTLFDLVLLDDLVLKLRTIERLGACGYVTVHDILQVDPDEFAQCHGVGPATVADLRHFQAEYAHLMNC
ncbi:MAG: hypothetical protein Q4B68_01165 [Bacteroidales bacterium]|nr:hypothetical protein [Bacteroidales bacterium]